MTAEHSCTTRRCTAVYSAKRLVLKASGKNGGPLAPRVDSDSRSESATLVVSVRSKDAARGNHCPGGGPRMTTLCPTLAELERLLRGHFPGADGPALEAHLARMRRVSSRPRPADDSARGQRGALWCEAGIRGRMGGSPGGPLRGPDGPAAQSSIVSLIAYGPGVVTARAAARRWPG